MVTFSGWKRFEMNETLKFHGVTEMTFPSIVRRSLIIDRKGSFAGAQRLSSLARGTQGYFLMQGHERFRDLTAYGGCCSLLSSVSCATSALRPSGKRLKGALRAGTALSKRRPCARLAGSLRTASVTGTHLGQARAWWRPWRRGRYLVGCWATKRGLSGVMCLS